MDVQIDPPTNTGLAELLISDGMRSLCLYYAQQAAQLYRGRVHKDHRELEMATVARTTVLNTRYGPRHAGEVIVDSPHFLPHEEGWTEDGESHPGAHDFNAVLAEMAGLPVPSTPSTPAAHVSTSVKGAVTDEPGRMRATRPQHEISLGNVADELSRRRIGYGPEARTYDWLKRYTAEVESRHGRDAAAVGRHALAVHQLRRSARGLPPEPGR